MTHNQLLSLIDTIHISFVTSQSLEFRVILLDISKAFDKAKPEG